MVTPIITDTDALLQVGRKIEEAFRFLIESSADVVVPNLDTAVVAFSGTGSERITYPAVICEVSGAREVEPGAGMWEFELLVTAAVKFTFRRDRAERAAGHLMGGVHDILFDVERTRAVLNSPAAGEDDYRTVREFHLEGYFVDDVVMGREGRVAMASVTVHGVMHPWEVLPRLRGFAG